MNDETKTPDAEDELRNAYIAALVAFNATSAIVLQHLVGKSAPNDAHVAAEESARAAVVATRRRLWAAYAPLS